MDNLAAVITASGGIVATVLGTYVALRNSKGAKSEGSADRKAVAVTEFERTAVRVDALWDTIKDLITEVAQLKEDKEMQQEAIDKLTKDLDDERKNHRATQAKLDELIEEHNKTLKLLADKEELIKKIMGDKANGKATDKS